MTFAPFFNLGMIILLGGDTGAFPVRAIFGDCRASLEYC